MASNFFKKLGAEELSDMEEGVFAEEDLMALVIYIADEQDELYELVVKLCEKHEPIVQRLNFLITTYFIDKHITQSGGSRYAH